MSEKKRKGITVNIQSWPGTPPTQFHDATYYLTRWFLGAANAELRDAGSEGDVASVKVVHRISAVFLAAAAFESHLNRMADELVDGSNAMSVHDLDGALAATFKGLSQLRWRQKLGLYSFLSAAGNRWALSDGLSCVKLVEELMSLRNRLIHAPPEKEELQGDRETAQFVVHNKHHVEFGTGHGGDLPDEILRRLEIQKIRSYLDAVEELIRRLQSLGELWPEGTESPRSRRGVQELDENGSRPWRDLNGIGHEVRWCNSTRRYVMHTFRPVAGQSPVAIEEASRRCRVAGDCSRVASCPWPSIQSSVSNDKT